MKMLFAAMLRHFSTLPTGHFSYTKDDANPENWLVWDDEDGSPIYDENTKPEAIAITALLNMGFPYQYEALASTVEEAVGVLNDPTVVMMLANVEEYAQENEAEKTAKEEAEIQRRIEFNRRLLHAGR